jgi:hypothetical protein
MTKRVPGESSSVVFDEAFDDDDGLGKGDAPVDLSAPALRWSGGCGSK